MKKPTWDNVFLTELELGWLAGLLEGEGTFFYAESPRKGGGTPIRRLIVCLKMTDEDIVRRAHDLVNVGSIQYQASRGPNLKPQWIWTVSGQQSLMVMELIYPHMGQRRREQIANAVHKYQAAIG